MKVDQKARVDAELQKRFDAVGELLRSARISNRMTQDDLAVKCEVGRQTVSRIERGEPSVAWGQVGRVAYFLGVAHILGGDNLPEPRATWRRVRTSRSKDEPSSSTAS